MANFKRLIREGVTLTAGQSATIDLNLEDSEVIADEKILRNVIRRILHNAVKFADEGSKVIVKGSKKSDGYQIVFSNSGKPIEERKIKQIFKPFTLNESILNHTTGTGLGLSVCQAMLRLHGTTLSFNSSNDRIEVSFALQLSK